jgi:hypothetical protein
MKHGGESLPAAPGKIASVLMIPRYRSIYSLLVACGENVRAFSLLLCTGKANEVRLFLNMLSSHKSTNPGLDCAVKGFTATGQASIF